MWRWFLVQTAWTHAPGRARFPDPCRKGRANLVVDVRGPCGSSEPVVTARLAPLCAPQSRWWGPGHDRETFGTLPAGGRVMISMEPPPSGGAEVLEGVTLAGRLSRRPRKFSLGPAHALHLERWWLRGERNVARHDAPVLHRWAAGPGIFLIRATGPNPDGYGQFGQRAAYSQYPLI